MKKLIFLSIFLCFSISCISAPPAITRGPLVQFALVEEPTEPLNLNSIVINDPTSGSMVCFKPEKAKELKIYTVKLRGSLKEANIIIKNANEFIEKNVNR